MAVIEGHSSVSSTETSIWMAGMSFGTIIILKCQPQSISKTNQAQAARGLRAEASLLQQSQCRQLDVQNVKFDRLGTVVDIFDMLNDRVNGFDESWKAHERSLKLHCSSWVRRRRLTEGNGFCLCQPRFLTVSQVSTCCDTRTGVHHFEETAVRMKCTKALFVEGNQAMKMQ
jgi:hypothetical protein